jgi:glycosyltransferase involved in cell wall biosynthesis
MTAVSLVMPVWRPDPEWLRAAVSSALSDAAELELLLVDDGGEADLEGLLDGVVDQRVQLLRTAHGGPSHARNVGLAAAEGSFIRFVDADDVVVPNSTSRLLARSTSETIVHAATVVCDEAMRPERTIASELEGRVERECLLGRFDTRVVSLLFPRPVIDAAGPWDVEFEVSGDWDFVLRCIEQAPVRRDPGVATYYRRNPESVSRAASVAAGEAARRRVLEKYFERHPAASGSRLAREAAAEASLAAARGYAARGAPLTAAARVAGSSGTLPLRSLATALEVARLALAKRSR